MEWESMRQRTLRWTQPELWHRKFELRAGEQRAGSLEFVKAFGSLAAAEVSSWRWTLKREGFWNPRITVRVPGSEENVAFFQPNWLGAGVLVLSAQQSLPWKSLNFWATEWAFLASEDHPMVSFKHEMSLKQGAGVAIASSYAERPEIPLLLALGWYLMVLRAEESAAGAAVIAAG